MNLTALVDGLRTSRGVAHKCDIAATVARLGLDGMNAVAAVGDDCAAIRDGDGWLLLAIEGFMNAFVDVEPWFAGWCGVMVNASDVYAMGGRPLAVVDALWSAGAEGAAPVLDGLAAASRTYGIPVVGGHSNSRSACGQLSVAILGRARALLTSFDARADDVLLAAIDLRGGYRPYFANWDAASGTDPKRLRDDLDLLPQIAEDGLCRAGKDISQAGVLGTLLMLLECSGVGAVVDPAMVPRPVGVASERWLLETFPSFGFLLAVPAANVAAVSRRFAARGIHCGAFGRCTDDRRLRLHSGGSTHLAWDFAAMPVIGCRPTLACVHA